MGCGNERLSKRAFAVINGWRTHLGLGLRSRGSVGLLGRRIVSSPGLSQAKTNTYGTWACTTWYFMRN